MSTTQRFRPGERLYSQGSTEGKIFRLVTGRALLSIARADGHELLSQIIGRGEAVGFSTVVDDVGYPQSAVARTPVVAQVVTFETWETLCRDHTCFSQAATKSAIQDIRLLLNFVEEMVFDRLDTRLAKQLLVLCTQTADGQFSVRLSQSEIASLLAVSRQSLNKSLGDFEERGLLRRSYRRIELIDVDGISVIANPRSASR